MHILAPGILVRCFSKVIVPYFKGTNHPGIVSIAVSFGVITNIIFLYLLLPSMGLRGAAWAMTLGYVVNASLLLASFCFVSKLTFLETWTYRSSDFSELSDIFISRFKTPASLKTEEIRNQNR